jgi:hypothetical protein
MRQRSIGNIQVSAIGEEGTGDLVCPSVPLAMLA